MNNGRWDGVGVAITDPSGVRINIGVGIHVGVYVDVGTPVGVGVGIHAGVHARRAKPCGASVAVDVGVDSNVARRFGALFGDAITTWRCAPVDGEVGVVCWWNFLAFFWVVC